MVALIREPPATTGRRAAISLRSSHDEVDVSAIARERGRRRAPPGGRLLVARSRSRRSSSSSAASSRCATHAARALRPVGVVLVDKPAGPVVLRARRRAAPPHAARGPVTRARSTRSRPGCCVAAAPARRPGSRRASSGSTSATSPTSTSRRRRRPATRKARCSSSTSRRRRTSSTPRSRACAARSSCRSRPPRR